MWTCVKCSSKVDDDFEVCWNCGTSKEGVEDPDFITADDVEPITDPMYDQIGEPDPLGLGVSSAGGLREPGGEVVEVYQAFSLIEAKFIADQLAAEGITAMSDTQDMQDALGVMDGNPRVYVQVSDLPRAQAWLAEYERKRQSDIGRHLDHP